MENTFEFRLHGYNYLTQYEASRVGITKIRHLYIAAYLHIDPYGMTPILSRLGVTDGQLRSIKLIIGGLLDSEQAKTPRAASWSRFFSAAGPDGHEALMLWELWFRFLRLDFDRTLAPAGKIIVSWPLLKDPLVWENYRKHFKGYKVIQGSDDVTKSESPKGKLPIFGQQRWVLQRDV